jgi:hypothetical protein
MSYIVIAEGPHGLHTIEVYHPNKEAYVPPLSIAREPRKAKALLMVMDAQQEVVADAWLTKGTVSERDSAEQWLLDFTRCSL